MYVRPNEIKQRTYTEKLGDIVLEPCKLCNDILAIQTLEKDYDMIKRSMKAVIQIFCTNRKCTFNVTRKMRFDNVST